MNEEADRARRYRRALEGMLGIPATEGNRVDVLRNGDEIFPAMLDAIGAARSTVDFLTFIYWEGRTGDAFARALSERARAGVRVRVLLDALGAATMDRSLVSAMQESGCHVEWFRPVTKARFWQNNHRTHRKVLVCDEQVAFTGGVGIADEWQGDARDPSEWRDTHFRIRGPAVDGLRAAFLQNWAECGRPLFDEAVDRFPEQPQDGTSVVQVVRGAAEADWSDVSTLIRAMLSLARERIRITTAYFVPAAGTAELLRGAAGRGVEVDILVPGAETDKRFVQLAGEAYYEDLLDAGIRLWAFEPTMLHAKVMTVDGVAATVGSANFNSRSLVLDDEVNLAVIDPAVVAELDRDFEADRERSKAVPAGVWPERPLAQRAKERALGLIDQHL